MYSVIPVIKNGILEGQYLSKKETEETGIFTAVESAIFRIDFTSGRMTSN